MGQRNAHSLAAKNVNPASQASLDIYAAAPVFRAEHAESTFTRLIEQQTAKIPSDFFLFLALGSMAASAAFELTNRQKASRFVGMWPAALLSMGMYNKLVKILGAR